MAESPDSRSRTIVNVGLADYAQKRAAAYAKMRLGHLLRKDVLLFALRGVEESGAFVREAFAALESSSEETMMGNFWQSVLGQLATAPAVDLSDLVVEKDGTLWVMEVKAQTNTLNARSLPGTLAAIWARIQEYRRYSSARRREIKPLIGVLRGPSTDVTRTLDWSTTRPAGAPPQIEYRYLVGEALWLWLTGRPNVMALVGDLKAHQDVIKTARQDALVRLTRELRELLRSRGLPDNLEALTGLSYRLPR